LVLSKPLGRMRTTKKSAVTRLHFWICTLVMVSHPRQRACRSASKLRRANYIEVPLEQYV
jgi:hypothetical protein